MSTYLFGDILAVRIPDLIFMFILTIIIVFTFVSLFQYLKAYLFDSEFASVIGIHTTFLEYLLLILIALSAVILIRVAGIILVLALLTAPAATASLLSSNLKSRMILAI